jgi:MFS transporter, DHA1 family, quinolone resistance protein
MNFSSPRRVKTSFSILAFFYSFATGLPFGLIVLFVQKRGIGLLGIGVLLAIQSATVVLLELPTGGLADVWGKKKVLILSFAAGAAYMAATLLSPSLPGLVVAMLLAGASRALLSGTAEALFVDSLRAVAPDANLQQGFSLLWIASALGVGLGSLAGGFLPGLFTRLPEGGPAVFTRLGMPLCAAFCVWLSLAIVASLLLREPPAERSVGAPRGSLGMIVEIVRQSIAFGIRNRLVFVLIAAAALSALALSGVEAFWQPRFANLLGGGGGHARLFGGIAASVFLFSALGSALGAPLGRLARGRYLLVSALTAGVFGVALIAFALQSGLGGALVGFWVVYLLSGLAGPVFQALFNDSIPPEKRATMISFLALCTRGGVLAGGLGLGFLASHFSIPRAWMVGGCVALSLVPLYLYAERLRLRSERATAAFVVPLPPVAERVEP